MTNEATLVYICRWVPLWIHYCRSPTVQLAGSYRGIANDIRINTYWEVPDIVHHGFIISTDFQLATETALIKAISRHCLSQTHAYVQTYICLSACLKRAWKWRFTTIKALVNLFVSTNMRYRQNEMLYYSVLIQIWNHAGQLHFLAHFRKVTSFPDLGYSPGYSQNGNDKISAEYFSIWC